MSETNQNAKTPRKAAFWTGWGLSALVSALLLFSASGKLTKAAQAVEGLTKGHYPEASIQVIGAVELVATILFLVPQTNLFGAALLTAYLGGAVATHVQAGGGYEAAIIVGIVVWIASWLRNPSFRTLFPLVRP